MTAKEFLQQAYRLNQKIQSDLQELTELQEMAGAVSAPRADEAVQTSPKNEAPYVGAILKIMAMEEMINKEVEQLVDLKREIREAIMKVPDEDERLVLKFRYLHWYTWRHIGRLMYADRTTVSRWHQQALKNLQVPEDMHQMHHNATQCNT